MGHFLWDFVWELKEVVISAISIISFPLTLPLKCLVLKKNIFRLNCVVSVGKLSSRRNHSVIKITFQELLITNINIYHFDWTTVLSLKYKMCEMQIHS